MGSFMDMAKEHGLFHKLLERLEACLRRDLPGARGELKRLLLVLGPALALHAEIEGMAFRSAGLSRRGQARGLSILAQSQRRRIEALRREISELLAAEERLDFETLKLRAFVLCEKLRLHFYREENRLWPFYDENIPGALGRSLARQARREVLDLERRLRDPLIWGWPLF